MFKLDIRGIQDVVFLQTTLPFHESQEKEGIFLHNSWSRSQYRMEPCGRIGRWKLWQGVQGMIKLHINYLFGSLLSFRHRLIHG